MKLFRPAAPKWSKKWWSVFQRVQRLAPAAAELGLTHLPPTLRPDVAFWTRNRTDAGSESR